MEQLELWRFLTGFALGALLSGVPSLWAITKRPTFGEVQALIEGNAGVKLIAARLDTQDKILEKLDRHFGRLEEKVDEIHLDVEVQRRQRTRPKPPTDVPS